MRAACSAASEIPSGPNAALEQGISCSNRCTKRCLYGRLFYDALVRSAPVGRWLWCPQPHRWDRLSLAAAAAGFTSDGRPRLAGLNAPRPAPVCLLCPVLPRPSPPRVNAPRPAPLCLLCPILPWASPLRPMRRSTESGCAGVARCPMGCLPRYPATNHQRSRSAPRRPVSAEARPAPQHWEATVATPTAIPTDPPPAPLTPLTGPPLTPLTGPPTPPLPRPPHAPRTRTPMTPYTH